MTPLIDRLLIYLGHRKRAYQLTFGGPSGKAVLEDLAVYCMACESTFNSDALTQSALSGRREVWLRIQQHLGMSAEELALLYHGARNNSFKGGTQ